MESAVAQVEMPEELSVLKNDNDNDKVDSKKHAQARKKERDLVHVRSGLADARFAYSRRNDIFQLMEIRCGGPCTTDDAELLAELLVPFIVEAALFHKEKDGSRRCPEAEAFRYLRGALPLWTQEHPETLRRLVSDALAKRADAVAAHDPGRSKHVHWLPTMRDLVAALRPTREEARHLRGWGCIDPASPEERLEADRLRKRAERAAKGATPREESISARKPWEAMGISRAKWYRLRQQGQPETRETVSSAPCSYTYGTDEPVSPTELLLSAIITNDNADPVQASPSLIETGFHGRNITLSPGIVAAVKVRFPLLVPDLRAHLEDAEKGMDRTPKRNWLAVLYNRLKAKHRAVSRAATIAAKAGMPSLAAA